MIKLENFEVMGWEHAIRGMRNPMNSWEKSDSKIIGQVLKGEEIAPGVDRSYWEPCVPFIDIGENDHKLMMKLANAGPVHGKFRRMITVYVDITAPLYWWKEFDTYKVGTVVNSCSTMHKIHEKEFTIEDFSCEQLLKHNSGLIGIKSPFEVLCETIITLNAYRDLYLKDKDKKYWWQMIQLLPSSYNQKRTVMLNYEVLAGIYKYRKDHKLDEWREFCSWIEQLPYSEIITGNTGGGVSLIDGHID
jgi:hypothetical protein